MKVTILGNELDLELVSLGAGGRKLAVYGVADWTPFVDQMMQGGGGVVGKFPYWIKIWEAAIVLADHMLKSHIDPNKEILEIGAGMGIVGLFLGAAGYRVTITDNQPDALALIRRNARHNGIDTITVKSLDWNDPDLDRRYDVVCGSELVYKKEFVQPIINLFRTAMTPDGEIFLAHDMKHLCVDALSDGLSDTFEMTRVGKTLRDGDRAIKIIIHQLRAKAGGEP